MDGVNSMTGNVARPAPLRALARDYDAILYVDDAHGFGVIGERSAGEPCPYGLRGNSIVRYFGESYENVVLVAGLSKAYSSLAAFIACPTEIKRLLKTAAPPYLYSGPSPVASLATTLAGLDLNDRRGDVLRADLWEKTEPRPRAPRSARNRTRRTVTAFRSSRSRSREHEDIGDVGRFLFESGIYVTLAAYPLVPQTEVGFRIQLTAANTRAEIDQLIDVLGRSSQTRSTCSPQRQRVRRMTVARPACARGVPLWAWYLVAMAALTAAYLLVPPFKG